MPWKVYKNKDQYCVHKTKSDGSKGERVSGGCHLTEDKAQKHKGALFHAESQSKEINEEKNMAIPSIPGGITSFEELDRYREALHVAERARQDLQDFHMLVDLMWENPFVENKDEALLSLTKEFVSRNKESDTATKEIGIFQKVGDFIANLTRKDNDCPECDKTGFLLFKDKGDRLRFVVRYSNKFRDEDRPVSEIISENSHRRFDEMVDKGIYEMPELWLWHVPNWKFGEADWHAYDDSGFAMASGLVDEGKESVALWLSKQKGVRTSHGMPPASIVYDPEDPDVIIEHQTVEISVLPESNAANKMTGFYILGNESKETGMGIPSNKLAKLISKWGASEELLKELELANADDANEAKAQGIESKETGEPDLDQPKEGEKPAEKPEEPAGEPVGEPTEEPKESTEEPNEEESQAGEDADNNANKATGDSPTREEIAKAVVDAVRPIIEENRKMTEEVAQLRKEVTHLKDNDEEKIEKAVAETTPASIGALIAQHLGVTHSKETEVDGRTSLAKSKPKETDPLPGGNPNLGILSGSFIDEMISGQESQ